MCEFKSNSTMELLVHVDESHKSSLIQCTYCEFKAKDNEYLQVHVVTKHEDSAIITIVGNQQLMLLEAMEVFKTDIERKFDAFIEGQNAMEHVVKQLKEEVAHLKEENNVLKNDSNVPNNVSRKQAKHKQKQNSEICREYR